MRQTIRNPEQNRRIQRVPHDPGNTVLREKHSRKMTDQEEFQASTIQTMRVYVHSREL
jgi:hypothetical protein